MSMGYLLAKIKYVLKNRNMNVLIDYFRNNGIIIGDRCNIYSNIITSESELISIGDDVTISNDVQLITHDNSICKVLPEYTDVFGEIVIGNNCFIGARVTILPGVNLADNIIVGSGSVVTKSFYEQGIVIGGNPAKKICRIDEYREKIKNNGFNIEGLSLTEKRKLLENNKDKFIVK